MTVRYVMRSVRMTDDHPPKHRQWPTPAKHRGKTSAHASTLLKSVLQTWWQVFRMLSKTQNGSDFDVLPFLWKCKRNNERDNLKTRNNYSLHVQEVVLCKKINQRWLSINLLYKTFFKEAVKSVLLMRVFCLHFCFKQ
jgi:hypothetical protein